MILFDSGLVCDNVNNTSLTSHKQLTMSEGEGGHDSGLGSQPAVRPRFACVYLLLNSGINFDSRISVTSAQQGSFSIEGISQELGD